VENVRISSGRVIVLLGEPVVDSFGKVTGYTGVTSNTTGEREYKDSPTSTFQAVVSGTGSVTATVNIYGSNDGTNFATTALGTITLSGTTTANNGFTSVSSWKYVRADLTNLTGTGAACYVLMGI
jgi:hypothetical protein